MTGTWVNSTCAHSERREVHKAQVITCLAMDGALKDNTLTGPRLHGQQYELAGCVHIQWIGMHASQQNVLNAVGRKRANSKPDNVAGLLAAVVAELSLASTTAA